MSRALLVLLGIALVLVGPVMFLISRTYALDQAFARLRPGDTRAQVLALLGEPQRQVRLGPPGRGARQYRYRVWPLPGVWEVDLRAGRVVGTPQER